MIFFKFTGAIKTSFMASIRKLKDEINKQSYELINECFTAKRSGQENGGRIDKVIKDLVRMRNELIRRSNHAEHTDDPVKLREHYRKIRADLGKLSEMAHGDAK